MNLTLLLHIVNKNLNQNVKIALNGKQQNFNSALCSSDWHFPELPSALSKPKPKKQKNQAKGKFRLFPEMELSSSNIKKFPIFCSIPGKRKF